MKVFYPDLTYEILEDIETYPIEEMLNELAGICGLYFGVSLLSLASLIHLAMRKVTWQRSNSIKLERSIKYALVSYLCT